MTTENGTVPPVSDVDRFVEAVRAAQTAASSNPQDFRRVVYERLRVREKQLGLGI